MNKKEKAAFDAAIAQAQLLAALRWTEKVEKDLQPPAPFGNRDDSIGYDFNSYSHIVAEKWSSSISHGDMPKRQHSGSQNSVYLFSTKLRALKALRHQVELDSAKVLRLIDLRITAESEAA